MPRRASPWLRRALIGLALTLAAGLAALTGLGRSMTEGIDRQLYDARLSRAEAPLSDRVVIVDIDERSLAEQGRWPWSRTVMARLVQALVEQGGAAVVAFDVLFAEAEGDGVADQALVDVLGRTPTVVGYYLSSDRGGQAGGSLPAPIMQARSIEELGLAITDWNGYGANLPAVQAAARGAGFFNPIIDPDGVVRRLPLLGRHGDQVYESFALAILRAYLGAPTLRLDATTVRLKGRAGQVDLPLSEGLTALVPFVRGAADAAGPADVSRAGAPAGAMGMHPGSGRFLNLSATDVLKGRIDRSRLAGRIVLVGTSAPGLSDLRATPIAPTLPGVEVHAALVDAALGGAGAPPIHQRPVGTPLIDALAIVLVGSILALAMPLLGAAGTLVLTLLGLGLLAGWHELAWTRLGWSLPLAMGCLLVIGLGVLNLGFGYLLEGRARRAVAHLFGAYVSPDLVEQMTRNPARFARMSSENRELSIMFTDIRGFTRIAESMEPADLREYINDFLTAMTEVIHRHHGTVDKYIGDAVMAFWGAPIEDPTHADRAVAAAQAMLDEVERLNRVNARRGWPPLVIGIGINTGIACVGDMGSRLRRAYTVLGDAVNLASRIESLTKQFGTPVIVGETTARRASTHEFRELAQVSVAGRTEQVRIYVPRVGDEAPIPGQILSALVRPAPGNEGAVAAAHTGGPVPGQTGGQGGGQGGLQGGTASGERRHEAARIGL